MLTMEKTADYVNRWVAAFESKDLDRVLAFYTDDVIFHSPLVARLSHDPSGTVQGKAALRAYVKKGFLLAGTAGADRDAETRLEFQPQDFELRRAVSPAKGGRQRLTWHT